MRSASSNPRTARIVLILGFACLIGSACIIALSMFLDIASVSILLSARSRLAWSTTFFISEVLGVIDHLAYIVVWFCLLFFYREYSKTNTPFSPTQSRRMFISAICFVVIFAANLLEPYMPAQEVSEVLQISLAESGPSLELLPLLMAGFFFVLSSVFKYGNAVQEDSDDIL